MIIDSLRVSGATRAGIYARAHDGGSLTVRNSYLEGNGFGDGASERGGMVLNDPYFEEAHANVLIENTDFRNNYQGLRADFWYDPDSAEGSESFEISGSRFVGNGSLVAGNEVGALVLPWAVGATSDGSARLSVIDTIFEDNSGQAVGAIQLNSERGLKMPNPMGVSLLISGSTFVGNVAGTQEWLAPASDIGFATYGFAAVEAPNTMFTLQNTTMYNGGKIPSISVNEDSGEIVLDHVTLQGGGVIVRSDYPEIEVRNSVIDSGTNDAFGTKFGGSEVAPPVVNTGTAFTKPAALPLGEGSFVASQDEIALGSLAHTAGVTPTMLPRPGSVLLNSALPSVPSLSLDQRGLPRPAGGGAADIGAVEVQLGAVRMLRDVTVDEGDPAEFLVELVNAGEHPVAVTAKTSNGSAKAGTDYDATSVSFAWEPGETGRKVMTVTTIADEALRADRSFTVAISEQLGASLLEPNSVTGLIRDTSSAPAVPPNPSAVPPGQGGGSGVKAPARDLSATGSGPWPILWSVLAVGVLSAGALLVLRGASRN